LGGATGGITVDTEMEEEELDLKMGAGDIN